MVLMVARCRATRLGLASLFLLHVSVAHGGEDVPSLQDVVKAFRVRIERVPEGGTGSKQPAAREEGRALGQANKETGPPALRFVARNTSNKELVFPRGGHFMTSGRAEGGLLQIPIEHLDSDYFLSGETMFKPHETKSFTFRHQLSVPDEYAIRWWRNVYCSDATKDGRYIGTIRSASFEFAYDASYEPAVKRSPIIVCARVAEATDRTAKDGQKTVRFRFLSIIKGKVSEKGFQATDSARNLCSSVWLYDYDFYKGQRLILYLTRDKRHRRAGSVRSPFVVVRLEPYSEELAAKLSAIVAATPSRQEPQGAP